MKSPILLTRDQFRRGIFARDGWKCVVCGELAILDPKDGEPTNLDAHHIYERRLWADGGYYLENGASVCEPCHIKCEQTLVACEDLHKTCGITKPVKPPQFYEEDKIDKWGNYILTNGNRTKGELFHDGSVQKILEPVLHLFSTYVKYPRTYHLPWSPKAHDKDERVMLETKQFEGRNVIVCAKMDGENTSLYSDYIHCRSLDMLDSHPSRSRIKALWSQIRNDIPAGWRLSMENLQGRHTIHYKNLPAWAVLFSVWNDKNVCQSWADTKEWAELLGLTMCPTIYEGPYNEELIKSLYRSTWDGDRLEGYVLRVADSFGYNEFHKVVGKYVSNDFQVNHGGHWKWNKSFAENELSSTNNHNQT